MLEQLCQFRLVEADRFAGFCGTRTSIAAMNCFANTWKVGAFLRSTMLSLTPSLVRLALWLQ